ncbi:MAG: hypothetical protein JJ899_01495 [Alphaproteobacteria bacterium]|nr:hypothetical protein [Alphaproteobacteria bacterium]
MARLIARYVSAAVVAAAVSFPGAIGAQDDTQRFPAGPANMFQPGAAFTFYQNANDPARVEGLNAALNTMTAQSQENANLIAAVRTGIAEGVAESDSDTLARSIASSIEGTFSIIVQAGFVRAMAQTNPAMGQMLRTARTVVHMPGGEHIEVPILLAAAVHSLGVIDAGAKLRDGTDARDMAGLYDMTVLGECGLVDAAVTFKQTDFVVEGTIGATLTFYGAIGGAKVYLVANEQRFAKITETGDGLPQIEVPDRPSDLFEADLPPVGGDFAFKSITRGECAFKLTAQG